MRRRSFHRIRNADDSCDLAIDGYKHRSGPIPPHAIGLACKHIGGDFQFTQVIGIADDNALPVHHADGALARWRIKTHDLGQNQTALFRCDDNDVSQRILARLFNRSRQGQQFIFIPALDRGDGGDQGLAFRERAGLVDNERVDLLHPLQRFRVTDENSGLRAAAHSHHD